MPDDQPDTRQRTPRDRTATYLYEPSPEGDREATEVHRQPNRLSEESSNHATVRCVPYRLSDRRQQC